VDPPALRARLPLPAGNGALIYSEGSNDRLQWAAVGQQGHDREHQPLRLVHAVEGGVGGLGEGATAPFTLVAALFLTMDHDVALSRTAVGAAASIVAPSFVRVHANSPCQL
jgi:hypothetical protein